MQERLALTDNELFRFILKSLGAKLNTEKMIKYWLENASTFGWIAEDKASASARGWSLYFAASLFIVDSPESGATVDVLSTFILVKRIDKILKMLTFQGRL